MDYVDTINSMSMYFNTDIGYVPILVLLSVLLTICIVYMSLRIFDNLSNEIVYQKPFIFMSVITGLLSAMVFCAIEPCGVFFTTALVPIYDVKFDNDISMVDIETKYIIIEKSKDFEDSYKVIIKDDSIKYNFINSDIEDINNINEMMDNYTQFM